MPSFENSLINFLGLEGKRMNIKKFHLFVCHRFKIRHLVKAFFPSPFHPVQCQIYALKDAGIAGYVWAEIRKISSFQLCILRCIYFIFHLSSSDKRRIMLIKFLTILCLLSEIQHPTKFLALVLIEPKVCN